MLAALGAAIVGITFIVTGLLKAISPDGFRQHLYRLGVFQNATLSPLVALSAAGEAALGIALILGFAPGLVLPATIVVVIALTFTTWLSLRSGRVNDCGCYGGYAAPSLAQTMLINSALVFLLAISLAMRPVSLVPPPVAMILIVTVATLFGGFARFALRHSKETGEPLIDLSPIRIGNAWKKRWSAGDAPSGSDELIVAYLGPDCPFCKLWIPVLNGIHESPALPRVRGIIGGTQKELEEFKAKTGVRFPANTIAKSMMSRLVQGVPTTVVIKGGQIDDIWSGQLSPQFLGRFKEAFFPGL